MNEYTPDRWVAIKVDSDDAVIYKVFGTWYGGYLGSDSWRMNSGVAAVEADGDVLIFHGFSGSAYRVHKDAYGTSGWSGSILASMIEKHPFEILPADTDWLNLVKDRRA